MMEIHAKATDLLSANVSSGVHKPKDFLSLRLGEERRVEKFRYPVHLMGVSYIKRDLNVFIGVFNHDDAIVVNVGILPFALEKVVQRFCTSVVLSPAALKWATTFPYVNGWMPPVCAFSFAFADPTADELLATTIRMAARPMMVRCLKPSPKAATAISKAARKNIGCTAIPRPIAKATSKVALIGSRT